MEFPGLLNYWIVVVLMMTGFVAYAHRETFSRFLEGIGFKAKTVDSTLS